MTSITVVSSERTGTAAGGSVELPGVGENLQDYSEIYIQYACKQPITLNGRMDPLSKLRIGLEWMLNGTGLGASNHFEAGGFIRTRDDEQRAAANDDARIFVFFLDDYHVRLGNSMAARRIVANPSPAPEY